MVTPPIADAERIRRIAAELLEKADDASIDRAAQLIKLASEAENQAAQAAKYAAEELKLRDDLADSKARRSSEERRAYITSLTPVIATLLSTAALFGTLVLQYSQYRSQSKQAKDALDLQIQAAKDEHESAARTLDLQAKAADDVRWNEAIKIFAADKRISPTEALLPTFSQSTYREASKRMARKLLISSKSEDDFESLFKDFYVSITWDNLADIVQINKAISDILVPLTRKGFNFTTNAHDKEHQFTKSEEALYTQLLAEEITIDRLLATLLTGRRPAGYQLDFTSTNIHSCNLNGADLHGAILTSAGFFYDDVKGADFSQGTQFEGANFDSTAWWEARVMSRELLNYLITDAKSKYDPTNGYGTAHTKILQADYDREIQRLIKASGISPAR